MAIDERENDTARNEPVPTASTDQISGQPPGVGDVRDMQTTVGAASSGVLIEEDVEQARLRLHDVQVILTELGYLSTEHGALLVDGTWGPETRDAIAEFQADRDLDRTGQLDGDTYEALLATHETALEPHAKIEGSEDDFGPLHADHPVEE